MMNVKEREKLFEMCEDFNLLEHEEVLQSIINSITYDEGLRHLLDAFDKYILNTHKINSTPYAESSGTIPNAVKYTA